MRRTQGRCRGHGSLSGSRGGQHRRLPGTRSAFLPNDEFTLNGGGDFKVRILTTGGFSPDGLTGVTPDRFEDFLRLHATRPDGKTVLLTEVGGDDELDGGALRVVGMSDLGRPSAIAYLTGLRLGELRLHKQVDAPAEFIAPPAHVCIAVVVGVEFVMVRVIGIVEQPPL